MDSLVSLLWLTIVKWCYYLQTCFFDNISELYIWDQGIPPWYIWALHFSCVSPCCHR